MCLRKRLLLFLYKLADRMASQCPVYSSMSCSKCDFLCNLTRRQSRTHFLCFNSCCIMYIMYPMTFPSAILVPIQDRFWASNGVGLGGVFRLFLFPITEKH